MFIRSMHARLMHASMMHLMASDTNKQCKRSRQPEHAAHNAAGLVALLPAISSLPPPAASPDAALLLRNELLQLRRRPVMWVLLPSGHLTTRGQLLQTGRPACRNARPRSLSEVHDAAGASTCLDLPRPSASPAGRTEWAEASGWGETARRPFPAAALAGSSEGKQRALGGTDAHVPRAQC